MKKNLFLPIFIVATAFANLNGQWIQTLELQPETPTIADSIYLIATVQTPHSSCSLNRAEVNIQNAVVGINACYANGILTAICQRTDTIALGKIEEVGDYELLFMASIVNDFDDTTCMGPFVSEMSSFNFTVDFANPIVEVDASTDFELFPNPSKGIVEVLFKNETPFYGQLEWFDQYGKKVHSQSINPTNHYAPIRVNLGHLPNGLYYCSLTTSNQIRFTKRLMLIP